MVRRWLLRSTAGRIACVVLLVVFVFMCGFHLGMAHHDAAGDSLVLAILATALGALALVSLGVRTHLGQALSSSTGCVICLPFPRVLGSHVDLPLLR
jgi:hypothetical protein